jgi:hypothetical protein
VDDNAWGGSLLKIYSLMGAGSARIPNRAALQGPVISILHEVVMAVAYGNLTPCLGKYLPEIGISGGNSKLRFGKTTECALAIR